MLGNYSLLFREVIIFQLLLVLLTLSRCVLHCKLNVTVIDTFKTLILIGMVVVIIACVNVVDLS